MKFDLHTHHERCGHAAGKIEQYIEAAIAAGLHVIGITDHSPYLFSEQDHPEPTMAMARSELALYVGEVLRLRRQYRGKIEVLLGMESDYFAEHEALYRHIYAAYPFDYLIGSVHLFGGSHINSRTRWQGKSDDFKRAEKEQYYRLILQSVQSGMFQIIGHIDGLKAYNADFADFPAPLLDDILQTMAARGIAMEVNSSGKLKGCAEWFPSDDILQRACYYGTPVTFGSDAHQPDRVGTDREQVRLRLLELGFRHWVYFRGKCCFQVALDLDDTNERGRHIR